MLGIRVYLIDILEGNIKKRIVGQKIHSIKMKIMV